MSTINKKCEYCPMFFVKKTTESLNTFSKRRFCSVKCNTTCNKPNLGKKHSNETRLKMSIIRVGKKYPNLSESLKGRIPWNKGMKGFRSGIPRPPEVREKISKSRTGRPVPSRQGCNSSNWKGGITPINRLIRGSIEYRLWKESVFKRDNWTCQECNERGGELHAHHIKPFALFPDLRLAIDNGITLCKVCHTLTETYGGNIRKISNNFTQ